MEETFAEIQRRGITTALVSSSIQQFANWLGERLGVPHVYANPMIVGLDGLLTGEIELAVPCHHKHHITRELREKLGVNKDDVLAVGDSPLDFTMFEEAGRSCCVAHAPEEVKAVVTYYLPDDSLAGVLDLLES
jgi:phosphoserine phosphatase